MIDFERRAAASPRFGSVLLIAAFAAAACGDEPTGVTDDGIRVVAAPARADTIGAQPVQALVIDVGGAEAGTVVRFEVVMVEAPCWFDTSNLCDWPSMTVGPVTGEYVHTLYVDSTDQDGRALAQVGFGVVAGPAGVVVLVPELGLADTIEFTVLPGAPALIRPADFDSLLILGEAESVEFVATDRVGNRLDLPVTLNALDPLRVVVDNGTATPTGVGAGRIEAIAGALRDTLRLLVYPPDTVTVQDLSGNIQLMRFDGSLLATLTAVEGYGHGGAERDPLASRWFYFLPDGNGWWWNLYVVALNGTANRVAALNGFEWSSWPEFSGDGEWIYFDGRRTDADCVGIWRMDRALTQIDSVLTLEGQSLRMPRPSPDGTRVAALTGSCWDGQTDGDVRVLELASGELQTFTGDFLSYAWSPASDRLALGDSERTVVVALPGGQIQGTFDMRSDYGTLEWGPGSEWLLIGNRYEPAMLVQVSTGERLRTALPGVLGLDWIRAD